MTAFDSVRRRRTQVMVATLVVVVLMAAGFGYLGARASLDYKGAKQVESSALQLPLTPVGMLATVDEANVLSSVTLMVLRAGDRPGGSILSVPVSVDSTLGSGDVRIPFTESYATGGVEGLQFAVESALTVSLDVAVVATPAQTTELLAPVDQATAISATTVLTRRTEGELERDRRSKVEGAWTDIAAAIGSGIATPPAPTSPPGTYATINDITSRLFAGPVESRGLPVSPIDPVKNPDGKDVEALDHVEAIMVLAAVAPASVSTPASGIVFRIEAPAGYDAKVKVIVGYLLSVGANVKSIILSAPAQPASALLVGDFKFREQIEAQELAIGDIEMQVPDAPILGIDVILVLGTDFLDGVTVDDPSYTTPSSTTSTTTA